MINYFSIAMVYLLRFLPFSVNLRSFFFARSVKSCGSKLKVYEGVMLRKPQNIEIGSNVSINEYCYLHGRGSIKIGNNVRIAPYVGIFSFNHKFSDSSIPIINQGFSNYPINIGDDCWLGAGSKILAGVTIGNGCVIGAGAVVTQNIPANSIAVGNPAKVVKKRGSL